MPPPSSSGATSDGPARGAGMPGRWKRDEERPDVMREVRNRVGYGLGRLWALSQALRGLARAVLGSQVGEALAFGKAVYDQRRALGLSIAELAGRAGMSIDEIECIEEGAPSPPSPFAADLRAIEIDFTAVRDRTDRVDLARPGEQERVCGRLSGPALRAAVSG